MPSPFHKAIFSIEKHLYDVLNKSAENLEMCEICVNTHSDRRSLRVNLFIFTEICKGRNSFAERLAAKKQKAEEARKAAEQAEAERLAAEKAEAERAAQQQTATQ